MENSQSQAPLILYTGEGYLIFNVTSASRAIPIEGASIHITGADTQNLDVEYRITTNKSGASETIALKAPSKNISLSPGAPYGYARYNAEVTKEGYYTQRFSGMPVFDGVTSIQPVLLVAKAPFDTQEFNPSPENQTIE